MKTTREILVVFEGNNSHIAERIEQVLDPTDYPVSTRRKRWGFNKEFYLVVVELTDQQGNQGNLLQYDVEAIKEEAYDDPEIKHRSLTSRELKKYIGDKVAEAVIGDLGDLI